MVSELAALASPSRPRSSLLPSTSVSRLALSCCEPVLIVTLSLFQTLLRSPLGASRGPSGLNSTNLWLRSPSYLTIYYLSGGIGSAIGGGELLPSSL